ncbi:MAG TPA: 4Fe-4S binding protein [Anaerolineales bacterium]|nr:4Fe-4S binding protein [Anaerolineales bacterium]
MTENNAPSQLVQPAVQGTILEVRHLPSREGQELHTNIVLKGHPLPTSWRSSDLHHTENPELHWNPEVCIYCQQCDRVCPKGCLHQGDEGLEIDHECCDTCGECLKECPSTALQMIGIRTTAGDLLHKTLKQNYSTARKITRISITGGEPGSQTAFVAELLFQIEQAGIPAILETSGLAPFENLLPLLSRPVQIRFELITPDEQAHLHLTGYGNSLILENLVQIADELSPPTTLVVRTPLIRNQTATRAALAYTGEWLSTHLDTRCHRWEWFEPQSTCLELDDFSNQEWAQMKTWAAEINFPFENIGLVDRYRHRR